MSQPDTTKELHKILPPANNWVKLTQQGHDELTQQLESYINNKVKEARLKDWQDYWQFWIDPLNDDIECEEYIKDRIKELEN